MFEFRFLLNLSALRMDIQGLTANLRLEDDEGTVLFDQPFPSDGNFPESADQPLLFTQAAILGNSRTYSLLVSAQFKGVEYSAMIQFETPRPVCSHSSWTWDVVAKIWVPPTPAPGILFYWDEGYFQRGDDPWVPLPA
jgi:hypothetical protein